METLKKQIIEKLEAGGFQVDMENVSWRKQETAQTQGSIVNINGQTFQQPGQQITITKHFTILYECRVSDVGEQNPHDSLMCQFEVYEGDHKVQDLEINIYPDEIDLLNNLLRKIFGI
jgi:hypothetical protein